MNKIKVEVYGRGCDKYFGTLANLRKVILSEKLSVNLEEVTAGDKIVKLGRINMPAVCINGKIVSEGCLMTVEDARQILLKYL